MSLSRTQNVALIALGAGLALGILLSYGRFGMMGAAGAAATRSAGAGTALPLDARDQQRIAEVLARRFASLIFLVTRSLASSIRLFAIAIPIHLIIGIPYWQAIVFSSIN